MINTQVTVAGLSINGGRINLQNNTLSVEGFTSINDARVESDHGKIQSLDFAEIKNSNFDGAIVLAKTGGTTNHCYGGNTFSTQVSFDNLSTSTWNVAKVSSNVVVKSN